MISNNYFNLPSTKYKSSKIFMYTLYALPHGVFVLCAVTGHVNYNEYTCYVTIAVMKVLQYVSLLLTTLLLSRQHSGHHDIQTPIN